MKKIETKFAYQNNRALFIKKNSVSSISTLSQSDSFSINEEASTKNDGNHHPRGFGGIKPSLLSNKAICNAAPKRPTRQSSFRKISGASLLDQFLPALTDENYALLDEELQHQRQKYINHDHHIKRVESKERLPYSNSRLGINQHLLDEKVNQAPKIPRRRADMVWDFTSSCIDMNDDDSIILDDGDCADDGYRPTKKFATSDLVEEPIY